MTLILSLTSWPGARLWRLGHLRFSGRWADGRDAQSRRPAMTAPGGSKSRQAGVIRSGDDINTLVDVMAGRPLAASRPSALQQPVGAWPGRPKQAPGHEGAWRVEVKAGCVIRSGDDINTLVNVMAGRPLVASRPSALQRPVGGWPGRPKRAAGHDGAGGSKSRHADIIPSGDDIDTLVDVMAGRPLVASRPSALQQPVAHGRDAQSGRPAMTALGGSKSKQAGIRG